MTQELSRPVPLSKIGPDGLDVPVRATAPECAAVAARMGVPSIGSLECLFQLTVRDDTVTIHAKGRLRAEVTRECVVSAEDFETLVEEVFEVCFVPSGRERDDPDPDLPDEIPYERDTIDLGETTAEQLGLALDPYPRIEGATAPDLEHEAVESPFAALARRLGTDGTTE